MYTEVYTKKSYVVRVSMSEEEAALLQKVYREIINRLVLSPEELQAVKAIMISVPVKDEL
jgi:hypothetical protein